MKHKRIAIAIGARARRYSMGFCGVCAVMVDDPAAGVELARTIEPAFVVLAIDDDVAHVAAQIRAASHRTGIVIVGRLPQALVDNLAAIGAYYAESWLTVTSQRLVTRSMQWATARGVVLPPPPTLH